MSFPRASIVLLLVLSPLAAGAAAKKPAARATPERTRLSTELAPPLPKASLIAERIAHDVDWYRRNVVAAYESIGRHDAKWDAPALEALRAAAALWSDDPQRGILTTHLHAEGKK